MPPNADNYDEGLRSDACIYMEAVKNDAGKHEPWPPSAYWLSPDILLNEAPLTPPGGAATFPATAGVAAKAPSKSAVGVRIHKQQNCTPSSTDIEVHLYAGNPALAMVPPPDVSTVEIASGIVTPASSLTVPGVVKQLADWLPSTNAGDPDGPGHKCLIARAFPDNLSPDSSNFHLPDDPHVVQRNICIQPCDTPPAPPPKPGDVPDPDKMLGPNPATGLWEFPFRTVNLDRQNRQVVTIRALPVLAPSKRVIQAALPALHATHRYKRPAPYAPVRFNLKVEDREVRGIETDDRSSDRFGAIVRRLPFRVPFPRQPRYDLRVPLDPHQHIRVIVGADLRKSKVGDAHFFHVLHLQNNRTLGAATLVLMRVK